MKRPVLYWMILFVLGEVLVRYYSVWYIGGVAAVLFLVMCCCRGEYIRKNRKLLYVGILFFVLGGIAFGYSRRKQQICEVEKGTVLSFSGKITDVEVRQTGIRYRLATKTLNEQVIHVHILLEYDEELVVGDRIEGKGSVSPFDRATNPGGYDEQSYQLGKGNVWKMDSVTIQERKACILPVKAWLYKVRAYAVWLYGQLFSEENASLAGAMVLGERTSLDVDTKLLYQRNGIAHLIAISGLHIAMLGGTIYQFLRKLLGSYPIAAVMGIVFILLYGVMAGLTGATLRAIVMLIISIGADVSGRKYDSLTAIAISLLIMLIRNPYQLNQAGFLLSFGAVMGIAVIYPVLKDWLCKCPQFLDGCLVSISVQMVLTPIMLYYFYEVPVYGILLNLIVVPMMSLLLLLLIISVVFGSVSLVLGSVPAKGAEGIFALYRWLCECSEKLPFHTLCTGRPPVYWILLYYLILGLFLLAGHHNRKKQRNGYAILLGMLFIAFYLPGNLMVCMFDVGQGDGIYIRTPDRVHILVDGGSSSEKKVGTYVLKNGIKYYGGAELDYVLVSHSDSDHYSGVMELLEEPTVSIRHVVLPAIRNPDEAYLELVQMAKERGCEVSYIHKGDRLVFGEVTFDCVSPENKEYEDKNQGCMVLYMQYRQFDMLFTGDMDETVEQEVEGELPNHIAVLKVAHHGSATASSEMFLKHIGFQTALISVGEHNRYGHPAQEVMKRLQQYCEYIYLTKEDGGITIDSDGIGYRITTVK